MASFTTSSRLQVLGTMGFQESRVLQCSLPALSTMGLWRGASTIRAGRSYRGGGGVSEWAAGRGAVGVSECEQRWARVSASSVSMCVRVRVRMLRVSVSRECVMDADGAALLAGWQRRVFSEQGV